MKQTDLDLNFVNMADSETTSEDEMRQDIEFSCSLSVTSVPRCVFEDQEAKVEFEKLFTPFGCNLEFLYLKSFSRVRVTFNTMEEVAAAKVELHHCNFRGTELGVFFVERHAPLTKNSESNLKPPPLTKQFLISPPASPPMGWEQTREAHPIVNYDLLSALATLDPARPHELHPPSTSRETPSITVHLCEGDETDDTSIDGGKKFHPLKALPRDVVQTRMPERNSSV